VGTRFGQPGTIHDDRDESIPVYNVVGPFIILHIPAAHGLGRVPADHHGVLESGPSSQDIEDKASGCS
jgi:hypothetical protein